jgi:Y_Y_Y domain.
MLLATASHGALGVVLPTTVQNTPYPEDCQIHAGWHPSNGAISQQTIENLPAGIYTVKIQCSDNNSPWSEGTCAFVKTFGNT